MHIFKACLAKREFARAEAVGHQKTHVPMCAFELGTIFLSHIVIEMCNAFSHISLVVAVSYDLIRFLRSSFPFSNTSNPIIRIIAQILVISRLQSNLQSGLVSYTKLCTSVVVI